MDIFGGAIIILPTAREDRTRFTNQKFRTQKEIGV